MSTYCSNHSEVNNVPLTFTHLFICPIYRKDVGFDVYLVHPHPHQSVSWVYTAVCLCFVRAKSRATRDIDRRRVCWRA